MVTCLELPALPPGESGNQIATNSEEERSRVDGEGMASSSTG